jgi:hypothetical protein
VTQRHHEWFAKLSRDIQEDWERLRPTGPEDTQKAGHGGESTWERLLSDWLPDSYEIGLRKYILPEVEGAEAFETDIIVFNPSYPEALRDREEVLAGGVAAALSAKLTLNAEGIRDGVKKAAALRRQIMMRYGSLRDELLGPFPVGLVAHSHVWKAPESTPLDNIGNALVSLDAKHATHPRECLDILCVADLATWTASRIAYSPPEVAAVLPGAVQDQIEHGACVTSASRAEPELSPPPVGVFIAHLLNQLAYRDPTLRGMVQGLSLTGTLGAGGGKARLWNLGDVYSRDVLAFIPQRLGSSPDWMGAY